MEPPDPTRISELAAIGAISTSQRNMLKRSVSGLYYYACDSYTSVEEGVGGEVETRTTLGLKVGHTALGLLQLKYVQGYHTRSGSMRTAYQFESDQKRVLRATRRTSLTDKLGDSRYKRDLSIDSTPVEVNYDDSIEQLMRLDDYEQMSDDDCKVFAETLTCFYSTLDVKQLSENPR